MARLCSRFCLLAAVLCWQACNIDAFRTGGNSEKGYFEVSPDSSLAVGGWLTYTVRDWEFLGANVSGISFKLVSASNDASAHIRTMTSAADLVVDGLAPGQSRIAFQAVADGDSMDDAFTLDVKAVTRLGLGGCSQGGVYVRGTNGKVMYTFQNGATAARIKGLGLYPFAVEPAGGVTFLPDQSTTEAWTFAIPATAPSLVRVLSTLAWDYADYTMTIIDKSDIDGVVPSTALSSTYYGTFMTLDAVPASQGRPLCAQLRRVVTSSTPAICKLIKDGYDVSSIELVDDTVRVDLIAAGTCILTLVLPELGVTVAWPPWTLTTPEPSSGGGGHGFDD